MKSKHISYLSIAGLDISHTNCVYKYTMLNMFSNTLKFEKKM